MEDKTNSGLVAMKALANDEYDQNQINQIISDGNKQYNAFMLSRAKHELSNVVVLTEFLDELQKSYMHYVKERIADGSMSLRQYSAVLETTSNLLASSSEILSSVLKDDTLTMVLTTNMSNDGVTKPTISQASIISKLDDPQSRERVRNAVEQILKQSSFNSPTTVVTDFNEVKDEGNNDDK